jgi:hypothetical protein
MHAHPLLRPGFLFVSLLSTLGYLGRLLGRPECGADLVMLAALAVAGSVGFGLGRLSRAAR